MCWPDSLEMKMTRPQFFFSIPGKYFRVRRTPLSTFTSKIRIQSASGISAKGLTSKMPRLFTKNRLDLADLSECNAAAYFRVNEHFARQLHKLLRLDLEALGVARQRCWPAIAGISIRAGGFWAPVSGGDFPISVSVERRLVRLLTETGSRVLGGAIRCSI
jgi:hypothetical protein